MATVKIITVSGDIEVRGLIFMTIYNDGIEAGYEPNAPEPLTPRFIPKDKIVCITSKGSLDIVWKTKWNHDGREV